MASSTRLDLRAAKVLVVDDNPHSRDIFSQILIGFRVKQAQYCATLEEGQSAAMAVKFDLLLLDGELPDGDGVSLTQRIRTNADGPNFTAPIIVVSGHTPIEKVLVARDAGANMVLRKPITPGTLLKHIEHLARTSRDFITGPSYCGPDRRFRTLPLVGEERRASAIALTTEPERAMSQDEVDSIFG